MSRAGRITEGQLERVIALLGPEAVTAGGEATRATAQPGSPDILDFRSFLRALTVPPVGELAPPRTLVIWPKVLTVETVLTKLEFQYRQFARDASVLVYTAKCGFEAILDLRITSEELRRN